MTESRDVYLLTKSIGASTGNPLDKSTSYSSRLIIDCRVNEMGLQQQALLFAGKMYPDAKTVIVSGHPHADKLAFYGEYDATQPTGGSNAVIYDIVMPRSHSNTTAFYVTNTKVRL